jgi:cupin 2 domain-containing protein
LHDLPTSLGAEHVDELLRRPNLRIERIVSTGQASAETFWYDQTEHEWVVVLSGRAKLRYEHDDEVVEHGPGDAGRAHSVASALLDRAVSRTWRKKGKGRLR